MQIKVILVEPQLGENIGAVARVMSNFGFDALRIINPRDGWPNEKAYSMAANGAFVLDKAELFTDFKEAISDLTHLIATASKQRYMEKPIISPKTLPSFSGKIGLLLGRERSGLSNEEISYCNNILSIPTSELNPSLNIAQAAAICCYELSRLELAKNKTSKSALRGDLNLFLEFLESELQEADFFKNPKIASTMKRNIRNYFTRSDITKQELNTLWGLVKALTSRIPNLS